MSVFHRTRLERLERLAMDLHLGQVDTIGNDVPSRDYGSEANASRSNTLSPATKVSASGFNSLRRGVGCESHQP